MASKAPTIVSNISAQRMKDLYGSLALTNQYEVHFAGLNKDLIRHLTKFTFSSALAQRGLLRKTSMETTE